MDALKEVVRKRRIKLAEDPERSDELAPVGEELSEEIPAEGMVEGEELLEGAPLESGIPDEEVSIEESLYDPRMLGQSGLGGKVAALLKDKIKNRA